MCGESIRGGIDEGLRSKCKILIPHRVAIALIEDSWILRNDIIYYKPNAMPESCQDRFSKKFEYVFFFTKQPRYYFNLNSVREEHSKESHPFGKNGSFEINMDCKTAPTWGLEGTQSLRGKKFKRYRNPDGKNPGDIWSIPTQPSSFKHYAMFPEKLVEKMILCSTKPGDTVLDPFVGSGTTILVAERLNRIGKGFDMGYQDIQRQRLTEIQKKLL